MMLLLSQLPVAEAIIAAATYFSHRADLTGLSGIMLAGFTTLGAARHVTRCVPSVEQHWPWADISKCVLRVAVCWLDFFWLIVL